MPDITDKDYYTNSFHYDVRKNPTPFEKLDFEAEYVPWTSGGFIHYCEYPVLQQNPRALEAVWDRVSKAFRWGSQSLEGMFDLFNVTNTSVVLRRVTTNGPNFMQPLATGGIDAASANPIPAPRIFRLSVRYKF